MRCMKTLFLGLVFVLIVAGCSNAPKRTYAIAANSWIGYTPIAYAYEKGWLKKGNIELKWTNSLSESVVLADNGLCEGLFSTQYEALSNKRVYKGFFPVFSADRSYGADKIMSNVVDKKLCNCKIIDVYMESGSVNQALLNAFLKEHNIEAKLRIHDGVQEQFVKTDFSKPSIVITYEPFASILKKRGFVEIASSKTLKSILVLDLFFSSEELPVEQRRFIYTQFWRAYRKLQKDPHEFFTTIRSYLDGIKYEDFIKALEEIEWLPHLDKKILAILQKEGFDTKRMIQ